jgi:hypothetical protein
MKEMKKKNKPVINDPSKNIKQIPDLAVDTQKLAVETVDTTSAGVVNELGQIFLERCDLLEWANNQLKYKLHNSEAN